MNNFILSCDSTADLTDEYLTQRSINYVCFRFTLDETLYADDLGKSISFEDFYKAMADGAMTKTSHVNVEEYKNYFSPFLDAGNDILHVTLSSGLSGANNAALVARDELITDYPDRKIYIVDSLGASSGFGLLMDKLADLRDEGMDIDALNSWANENKLRLNHWFFSTDLTFYIRGGRISKTSGTVGTLLNICPLLNMDHNGKLIPRQKIRGKKKVIKEIVDKMEQYAENGLNYSGKCFISNSACLEDAQEVADLVKGRFPNLCGDVLINSIGTTIGSHTGPGTVALFFWGEARG